MKGRRIVNSLSEKETEVVSYLELEGKRFFVRGDVERFFGSRNVMNFYFHRLMKKGRIVKINREKYYLVPMQAFHGKWSEHPFVVADEMCNGRGYCIGAKSAAHYWGLIEQIPAETEVFSTNRQGRKEFFGFTIRFRRVRKLPSHVKISVQGHAVLMATKEESRKWK